MGERLVTTLRDLDEALESWCTVVYHEGHPTDALLRTDVQHFLGSCTGVHIVDPVDPEVVERVARGIYDARLQYLHARGEWAWCEDMARAAIEAVFGDQ